MKQIYSTIFALLMVTATAFATPIINAQASGNWTKNSNWSLNRMPGDNDTIVISPNITVTLDNTIVLNQVVLQVYGTLDLANGKLHLDADSKIIVAVGGKIDGNGANDQIRLNNSIIFRGTDPAIVGYAYADASTGGFNSTATLPVRFVSFTASKNGNNVVLNWITDHEMNNSHFQVERSVNGRDWNSIALVMGNGTSNVTNQYTYTDRNRTEAVVYYRIRQVDLDGRAEYSSVRSIRNESAPSITNIYTSSKQTVAVDFNQNKSNVTVKVVNLNGQVIAQQTYQNASYRITMPVSANTSGVHVVQVSDENGWSEVKKLIF